MGEKAAVHEIDICDKKLSIESRFGGQEQTL